MVLASSVKVFVKRSWRSFNGFLELEEGPVVVEVLVLV